MFQGLFSSISRSQTKSEICFLDTEISGPCEPCFLLRNSWISYYLFMLYNFIIYKFYFIIYDFTFNILHNYSTVLFFREKPVKRRCDLPPSLMQYSEVTNPIYQHFLPANQMSKESEPKRFSFNFN